jgi:hypothetical protein
MMKFLTLSKTLSEVCCNLASIAKGEFGKSNLFQKLLTTRKVNDYNIIVIVRVVSEPCGI